MKIQPTVLVRLSVVAFILGSLTMACKKSQVTDDQAIDGSLGKRALTIYTWEEYFDPDVLEGFSERTGIPINYVTYEGTDQMEARLKSDPGKFDIVVADDSIIGRLAKQKQFQRLDKERLRNLSNISEKYLSRAFDPGNAYSAPYMWGTTLVAYRADKIDNPDSSWSLLWDKSLKGKVRLIGDSFEQFSVALLKLGFDLNSEDSAEIEQARDSIIDLVVGSDLVPATYTEIKEGLESGEIWAASFYSGDAALLASTNENIKFFIPREGAPLWIDSFAIARDSEMAEQAHLFIDYMLEAEVAASSSNFLYYATPNAAAEPYLDEELVDDATIYPDSETLEKCEFWELIGSTREALLNQGWLAVRKAMEEAKKKGVVVGQPDELGIQP